MGKWQAGDPLSRTEDRLEGDPGITGATITAKIDSASTSAATGSHTSVAERLSRTTYSGMGSTMVKKSARAKLWKRRKEESQKRLFHFAWKSRIHRGIPTFPQLRLLLYMTNSYGINGDPSIETKEGTFLKHYDTTGTSLLTYLGFWSSIHAVY